MSPKDIRQIAIALLQPEIARDDREHWGALTRGGWSLLDQFDREGRRYLVAERCATNRQISPRDWCMLAARARGFALKAIAGEFGISVPSVSRRLKRAMSKLGVRCQSDLARLLGPGFAIPDDQGIGSAPSGVNEMPNINPGRTFQGYDAAG